jgi:DNA mismatch endonuclease (patch repair protein)
MHPKIFGSPDILIGEKMAIFIDSCFWHGCSKHKTQIPKTRKAFWVAKIKANKARDRKVTRILRKKGYKVVRIWEHEISEKLAAVIRKIGK